MNLWGACIRGDLSAVKNHIGEGKKEVDARDHYKKSAVKPSDLSVGI